jgi:MFS family permease
MLLAALGIGAVTGGIAMPWLRARLSDNHLLGTASAAYAVALAVVALVRNVPTVETALVVAGMAWMIVLANVNAIVQMFLPRWVRARGLGTYQVVFLGGQAVGALFWGLVAEHVGLVVTFLAAAILTAAGAATVLVWPFDVCLRSTVRRAVRRGHAARDSNGRLGHDQSAHAEHQRLVKRARDHE